MEKPRSSNSIGSISPGGSSSVLERQYAELLIKHNNMVIEFHQLEQELDIKNKTINDQLEQISNYERFLSHVKVEFGKTRDLMEKELVYYREMVEDYQLKFLKLNNELEYYKKLEFNQLESYSNDTDKDEKYNQLIKDFKILKSNFELEQNSKIMLLDQIESLSKENQKLKEDIMSSHSLNESSTNVNSETNQNFEYPTGSSIIHDLTYNYNTHTMNFNEDEETNNNSDDQFDNDFDYLENIEAQAQSSPIKEAFLFETPEESSSKDRVPSLIQTKDFQFPPSPDPTTKGKRQSLPANLQTEFILSPLKLASQDFDSAENQKRYSISRPNHNRYSSHDIVPIKVEFEAGVDQRSTSVPSPGRFNDIDERLEESKEIESTFKKLNGERNSYISSSKRSSLVFEANSRINNDLTKQEIMKLKFELQSLKLHNEKLMSYIGFELQKQKRNIKKLSSRQNLRDIEYSDSKLIERSREVLIQKKRVLRSVSINAILSKNYNNKDNLGILQKGILKFDDEALHENEYNEGEGEREDDDYGFMNFNDKFNKRIFATGLNNYYEMNDADNKNTNLKKFKSQNFFSNRNNFDISDVDITDTTLEDTIDDEIEWEDHKIPTNMNKGVFGQIRYLITGSYQLDKKAEVKESSVDDSLKYQFFSIAIGILIIGIRFGHYNHHNQV
ncbi:hypothetical protein CANTEDRAFT_98299 [Yamadazyma tenuis ATCC 10573]|uniref:Uncharacterized protein n=2 Tax=Candida tenuis TaxID=2315449 RepID=G3B531_CANTC|nr:uncharacterized protein CANTEDRAFT_98299 [Yamadazyma tenuis ATCC 10573]EGV63124.1 hypothetical protein CANTEDRAFT_98299 [Yamadazyma tenuis ATCC 10573]